MEGILEKLLKLKEYDPSIDRSFNEFNKEANLPNTIFNSISRSNAYLIWELKKAIMENEEIKEGLTALNSPSFPIQFSDISSFLCGAGRPALDLLKDLLKVFFEISKKESFIKDEQGKYIIREEFKTLCEHGLFHQIKMYACHKSTKIKSKIIKELLQVVTKKSKSEIVKGRQEILEEIFYLEQNFSQSKTNDLCNEEVKIFNDSSTVDLILGDIEASHSLLTEVLALGSTYESLKITKEKYEKKKLYYKSNRDMMKKVIRLFDLLS